MNTAQNSKTKPFKRFGRVIIRRRHKLGLIAVICLLVFGLGAATKTLIFRTPKYTSIQLSGTIVDAKSKSPAPNVKVVVVPRRWGFPYNRRVSEIELRANEQGNFSCRRNVSQPFNDVLIYAYDEANQKYGGIISQPNVQNAQIWLSPSARSPY